MLQGQEHSENSCFPIREVLGLVGDKWSIMIVAILEDDKKRFSELQRGIQGISQRMLTRTLKSLERNGLVTRTVKPTVPPSVYYALTPLGHTLLTPAKGLVEWALNNHPAMQDAQAQFDKNED